MQGFNNIFKAVGMYTPYWLYILYFILGTALVYIIFILLKRRKKPENKKSLYLTLKEKYRTLEYLQNDKKAFSVLASMLLRELFSYKLGVDIKPLTTQELKEFFTGLTELENENSNDNRETPRELNGDIVSHKMFDTNRLLDILTYLDEIKFKNTETEQSISEVLLYTKELLDAVLSEIKTRQDK